MDTSSEVYFAKPKHLCDSIIITLRFHDELILPTNWADLDASLFKEEV